MKWKISGTLISLTFIGLLAGCSKSSDSSYNPPVGGSGNNISIYGMLFSPSTKTVAKGAVVKWTNNDANAHTVTSDDGVTFDSGNLGGGASFSYTANTAGTFNYHCTIHGLSMAGTLVVNP